MTFCLSETDTDTEPKLEIVMDNDWMQKNDFSEGSLIMFQGGREVEISPTKIRGDCVRIRLKLRD